MKVLKQSEVVKSLMSDARAYALDAMDEQDELTRNLIRGMATGTYLAALRVCALSGFDLITTQRLCGKKNPLELVGAQ